MREITANRRPLRLYFATGLLILGLTACAVGPDYQRSDIDYVDQWTFDTSGAAPGGDALATMAWIDVFQNPELRTLVVTALEQNHSMRIAFERIEEAKAVERIARSLQFPTVDLEASGERENESALTETDPEVVDEFFVGPAMAWELDLWGRNRRLRNAAFARYLATEYGAQAVRLSLIAEVSRAYFELQGTRSRLAINRNTLNARQQSLSIAQKRFAGGLTSKLEVMQSEVDFAATKANLERVERNTRVAEHRLALLLGEPPTSATVVTRGQTEQYLPAAVVVGLPVTLLERRPDIMLTEQLLMAASEEVGVAIADRYPSIQLTGSFGTQTEEFNDLLDSDGEYWIANLDLVMPLFDAGSRRARVQAAESRFNQARLAWERAILEALREVADALVEFNQARAILDADLALEHASAEYLELATKRYRNGVLSYIDVLDAQRSLFAAQLSVSASRQAQHISMVELYKSLGGGWDPDDVARVSEN